MVNAHSHAFQIELRGRGERRPGNAPRPADFWSWRTEMYRVAAAHDPDSMHAVGRRAYREMARAGYGAVGEFHYLHHQPDGRPYAEPAAMAVALAEAALAERLEIVLLPAAYHRGGPGAPASESQRRFCDPDVETFLERVDRLRGWAGARSRVGVGVAVHSVRAVPASWIEAIAAYAQAREMVRHVHACEQRLELELCRQ
jgi:formimidoylglutamate deiminase